MVILEEIVSHFLTFAKRIRLTKKSSKSLWRLTISFTRLKESFIPSLHTKMVESIKLQSTAVLSKYQSQTPELHYQDDGWTTSKTPESPI